MNATFMGVCPLWTNILDINNEKKRIKLLSRGLRLLNTICFLIKENYVYLNLLQKCQYI